MFKNSDQNKEKNGLRPFYSTGIYKNNASVALCPKAELDDDCK